MSGGALLEIFLARFSSTEKKEAVCMCSQNDRGRRVDAVEGRESIHVVHCTVPLCFRHFQCLFAKFNTCVPVFHLLFPFFLRERERGKGEKLGMRAETAWNHNVFVVLWNFMRMKRRKKFERERQYWKTSAVLCKYGTN